MIKEPNYDDFLETKKYGKVFEDGTRETASGEIDLEGTVLLKKGDIVTEEDKLKKAVMDIIKVNQGL